MLTIILTTSQIFIMVFVIFTSFNKDKASVSSPRKVTKGKTH